MRKKQLSVTINNNIVNEVDKIARSKNISRSACIELAIRYSLNKGLSDISVGMNTDNK